MYSCVVSYACPLVLECVVHYGAFDTLSKVYKVNTCLADLYEDVWVSVVVVGVKVSDFICVHRVSIFACEGLFKLWWGMGVG